MENFIRKSRKILCLKNQTERKKQTTNQSSQLDSSFSRSWEPGVWFSLGLRNSKSTVLAMVENGLVFTNAAVCNQYSAHFHQENFPLAFQIFPKKEQKHSFMGFSSIYPISFKKFENTKHCVSGTKY